MNRSPRLALGLVAIIVVSACIGAPGSSPTATARPSSDLPTPSAAVQPTPGAPVVLNAPVLVRVPMPEAGLQAPSPSQIAVVDDAIWIVRYERGVQLLRFDTSTARFDMTVDLEYGVRLLAPDDGSLWAVGPWDYAPGPKAYTVSRINEQSGRMRDVMDVAIGGITVGLGSIWAGGGRGLKRIDPGTTETTGRWAIGSDAIQVACDAVWRWSWGADEALIRLDPATGDQTTFEGVGPVYDVDGQCWRTVDDGLERLWPAPAMTTPSRAASLQYDGSAFWRRPYGHIQAFDPGLGSGTGTTFILDKADISPYWKVGDDGVVVAAAGSLWLVNGFEIVGFDIPAG